MAAQPDRPAPAFPTEAEALAAPPHRDMSQACETYQHLTCPKTRSPHPILGGFRKGQWMARWECRCPCHKETNTDV